MGMLSDRNISAQVIKINTLHPFQTQEILESVRKTGRIVVAEECVPYGSIGQEISGALHKPES
jgi:pyruvate/2-oxoglutarate/acetoin dehydrogenase E1 component